jgi:Domain of unknown function (DUF1844)
MAEDSQDKPKIVVDDDWKAQARAEKERLAAQAESKQAASASSEERGGATGRELPPADFVGLVGILHSQAMFALGAVPDPRTNRPFVDLDLAKHHIDLLATLEDKTRNNLTDEEKEVLDRALYDARMQYVQVAQGSAGTPQ